MTWLPLVVIVVVLWCLCVATSRDEGEFEKVDVAKLASMTHGTELIVLENAYHGDRTYRFEDFFWTGSGDGAVDDDNIWNTEKPSTVYKTKTIVSTVYIENPATLDNLNNTQKCTHNCEGVQVPEGAINPTATYNETGEEDFLDADRQFWLLTVLKSDGKDPIITDLKRSLAKLYKTAFQRQQEKHLGINNRTKRDSALEDPVNVYIHDISKISSDGDENIQVVYHVSIAGKPIAATTAADDMTLVSDEEVQTELGYPFVVKAEPYLKSATSEGLQRARNTWIFIGTSILVLLILLLLIAFLTLGFSKRKRAPSTTGVDNRRQVFNEEGSGHDNKGFVRQEGRKYKKKDESPTYINFRHQPSNQTIKSGILRDNRPKSSSSCSTTMSGSSLDISPLMGLKEEQRTPPKRPPRPKAAINKTVPIKEHILDSDSSGTQDTIFLENSDGGIMSPKSYLSMPSVKSFPRTNMPEPLNRVLEPVSVLHLDMMDDDDLTRRAFVRHGSVGTMEDPGVIGPVVWNMHQQRLQHGVSMDEGIEDFKYTSSVSRMRKRFHDLLDDTFSLFGSRRGSPVPTEATSMNKPITNILPPRPKTCDPRRMLTSPASEPPRGAWTSSTPSPLVRPVSAGPTQHRPITAPTVNVAHILAEGRLRANDPAVPLIAAIKTELEKCSLPGSTTDLRM